MSDFFDERGEIQKSEHKLPHWQQRDTWVFVTWRLADSIPTEKLKKWKNQRDAWLLHHPQPWDASTNGEYQSRFAEPFESWLDQGIGDCLLGDPDNRAIVSEALLHFDGERYNMRSFVVMPNHVHVLFRTLGENFLPDILKSWKRHTAKLINKRENRTGTSLWQPEYFDRLIRSEQHFQFVIDYIRKNPAELPDSKFTHYDSAI